MPRVQPTTFSRQEAQAWALGEIVLYVAATIALAIAAAFGVV